MQRLLRTLWGDLTLTEIKKFGLLACALMLTAGPFWMLRGVREALFIDLVGLRWQPTGRLVSFLIIIPIIILYNKLVDVVKKERLFFVVYFFFGALFLTVALFVAFPHLFPTASVNSSVGFIPGRFMGWFSYVVFESFGTLAVSLFWSFVASYTTTDAAKRGYGMILSITQIGTIGGAIFAANFSQKLGLPIIIVTATVCILMVPFIIQLFLKINHAVPSEFFRKDQPQTGFFEGLRLLGKHRYLLGIFVISAGYEMVGTILEFQMNLLAAEKYPTKELFSEFYAQYSLFANGVTFIFALIGTSFFLRTFGLRVCLLLFPAATGIIICCTRIFPILPIVFISMIILKGLSYSLNSPAKEILYIPTSRDVKFKSKSWIDIFGVRSLKACGSGINAFFSKLAPIETIAYATPILLPMVFFWLITARFVSVKHHQLVEDKQIIG